MAGRPRKMVRYVPKSRGNCGAPTEKDPSPHEVLGCGEPVYKSPVRYKGRIWHAFCLSQAIKEGKA